MCSYIFYAVDIQVIKQHFDTSVIYYPKRFPTSFNQTLLKAADSERNLLSLCTVYVYLLSSILLPAFLSFSLLIFSKMSVSCVWGSQGLSHRIITKEQIKWSKTVFSSDMKTVIKVSAMCWNIQMLSVTYIIAAIR